MFLNWLRMDMKILLQMQLKFKELHSENRRRKIANIQKNVDSNHFEKISKITRSKETWDIMEKYYEGSDNVKQVKLQSLRRKYELMMMEDDQRISDYVSKLQSVVNQMKACGEEYIILDQQQW